MQDIRVQRDLANLPEPRFICTAPQWMRRFAAGILLFGAVFGGVICAKGSTDGNLLMAFGGPLAAAVCLAVVIFGRPTDWVSWISLAATSEGLYLVGQSSRVVFVPWRDVTGIGLKFVVQRNYAHLTLRMAEQDWVRFGNLSGITGSGRERQYLMGAGVVTGEDLVAKLEAFRRKYGRSATV